MNEALELEKTVITNGYCIGCGACASIEHSPFSIRMDNYGNYVAVLESEFDDTNSKLLQVCPFSNQSLNEDRLSQHFLSDAPYNDPYIGRYLNCYTGYVAEGHFREKGSSGGIGKWIGYKLLQTNLIDYFIHVIPVSGERSESILFEYGIEDDSQKVIAGSKSSYYPVRLDKVVKEIKNIEGKFAVTGVPCFIKAIRLLAKSDPELNSKIVFTVGIFCGGMKSANHSKMIGWQLGIKPADIGGIDFRVKSDSRPASDKIYKVWSAKDQIVKSDYSDNLRGTGWNGYFTPKACFFCDDVVAETADISIGDAWLPEYVRDPKGTSIMIVRNPVLLEILQDALNSKEIYLEEVSGNQVVQSQAGGFRQRRDALSYRIRKMEKSQKWYPKKRVEAEDYLITRRRKRIYTLREKISLMSHLRFYEAYLKDDLTYFFRKMKPLDLKYSIANQGLLKISLLIYRGMFKRLYLKFKQR